MPNNLNATVDPIIPAGTKAVLQLSSPQKLKSGVTPQTVQSLITDLINIQTQVNRLLSASQVSPSVNKIFVVNGSGQVVAAFGTVEYEGVSWTNFLSELHAGTPLEPNNPNDAVFNANADGSISIGNNGWVDIHDEFDGNAAWIGTQNDTLTITNAFNNGSNAIRLRVPAHPLATGNSCQVRNMNLFGVVNANGTWVVTKVDADHVDLQNSIWSGPFTPLADPPNGLPTYEPTIDRVLQIINATDNGSGHIRIRTNVAHGYDSGTQVNIPQPGPLAGVGTDTAPASGQWIATVVSADTFDLKNLDGTPSTFSGTFMAGGTVLEYFAGILAESLAIGPSFKNYKLRIFVDGSLIINGAVVSGSTLTGNVLQNATSTAGSPPNQLVLLINNGTLSIIGTGTQTGNGNALLDGTLTAATVDATAGNITTVNSTTINATNVSGGTVAAALYKVGATPGIDQVATVRNAAGTGTSTLTFQKGILTGYVP